MTNEEMEKSIHFIIGQQAQFAADLQRLTEVQAGFQTQLGKLSDATLTVVGVVGQIAEAQAKADAKIAALAEAQARTEKQLSETDERLNALINTVERYISSRNGKAES